MCRVQTLPFRTMFTIRSRFKNQYEKDLGNFQDGSGGWCWEKLLGCQICPSETFMHVRTRNNWFHLTDDNIDIYFKRS